MMLYITHLLIRLLWLARPCTRSEQSSFFVCFEKHSYRIISNISTVSNNSMSPIIEHLGAAFKK